MTAVASRCRGSRSRISCTPRPPCWTPGRWTTGCNCSIEDAKYEVPCNDAPDGNPDTDLLLIDDDYTRLRARVERLNSRRAHREYPHSRTNHQIFNVRVADPEGDGEIGVTASFTVWRFRGGKTSCYVGRYRYRLRLSDNGFRIAFKRAELDMTDLRAVSDVAIIL